MTHQLIQKESEKIIQLTLEGKTLGTATGKADKLKTTIKEFADTHEALKNFYKKEWESLKKGFVLTNPNAKTGEAALHVFIGGGYTGALAFTTTPKGIYIYKNNNTSDELLLIDKTGSNLQTINLPRVLAWEMVYNRSTNSLLLDLDHFIYAMNIEDAQFKNLGAEKTDHTSFLSVTDTKIAFATNRTITVLDNKLRLQNHQAYSFEVIRGTTPFCGKLSGDGSLLAFHHEVAKIDIIETSTGKLLYTLKGAFEMVAQMEFSKDNQLLIIREQYGSWGMRYFDLDTKCELKIPALEIPEYTKDVNGFCFNKDQSILVIRQLFTVHVFDFINKKHIHQFKIEHLVKKAELKFVEGQLGVRTDYGCFSIYNV